MPKIKLLLADVDGTLVTEDKILTERATGVTAYLKNGGTLEKVAAMANHASTRTTQLYDRRRDEVSLDEVERIVI
jgi:L-aminopeptidase/D-esterase-like protein